VILLAVLAVIGVAAARLGSQERVNASAKGRRDQMVACARAAAVQLWTEISRAGPDFLRSTGTPVGLVLPDGTTLNAPGAPTDSSEAGLPVADLVKQESMFTAQGAKAVDITNSMADPRKVSNTLGNRILAVCRDAKGRELAYEFTIKFALF
jgi:hypothetical protein